MALSITLKTSVAFPSESYNYAKLWQSWTIVTQEAYISGAVDGIGAAYFETMIKIAPEKFSRAPEPQDVRAVRERLFVRSTRDQVRDVMIDLYRDPSNAFISPANIFFLSRDKIEGKDITTGLMDARKQAIDMHVLNERMKR